jgi:hypothetical protein
VLVLGPFWGIAVYVAVAIIGSVVTTLYGRPPALAGGDPTGRARQQEWCLRSLVGLHDQLKSEVTRTLMRNDERPMAVRFEIFDENWQQDFETAASRCGAELDPAVADAYTNLRALHQGYALGIAQLAHTRDDLGSALALRVKLLTNGLPLRHALPAAPPSP